MTSEVTDEQCKALIDEVRNTIRELCDKLTEKKCPADTMLCLLVGMSVAFVRRTHRLEDQQVTERR